MSLRLQHTIKHYN